MPILIPFPDEFPDSNARRPDDEAAEAEEAPEREEAAKVLNKMLRAVRPVLLRIGQRRRLMGALAVKVMRDGLGGNPMSSRQLALLLGICRFDDPPEIQSAAGDSVRNAAKGACKRCNCAKDHVGCGVPCAWRRGGRILEALLACCRGFVTAAEFERAKKMIERLR